jgi:hypothetical protein
MLGSSEELRGFMVKLKRVKTTGHGGRDREGVIATMLVDGGEWCLAGQRRFNGELG